MAIGQRVRQLMGFNCLSQQDIADRLGMSQMLPFPRNARPYPSFSPTELSIMADLFHVSVDVLMGRQPLAGGVMFGFVSLGVSFASLVISCAALYWSRMARIEAAGAVERSRYALESSRKHVGLPYDHKIVHDWELKNTVRLCSANQG